jgi:hypothetical protein
MPFPSRADYETLLYNLLQQYADHILASTVHLYSTSALTVRVTGSIQFISGLELRVAEFVDFLSGRIRDYSYTVYLGAEKIRWYDPQPHPDNPALAATFPTTITLLPTSNTTGSLRRASRLMRPICRR